MLEQLDRIRECGYAIDNEECEMGIRCIAVPIRDYTGKMVAGLSVSGPTSRMTSESIREKIPYLFEVVGEISKRLGKKG